MLLHKYLHKYNEGPKRKFSILGQIEFEILQIFVQTLKYLYRYLGGHHGGDTTNILPIFDLDIWVVGHNISPRATLEVIDYNYIVLLVTPTSYFVISAKV